MGKTIIRNKLDPDNFVPQGGGGSGEGTGNIFTSSWENGGTGCGLSPLLDNGAWDDYGSAGVCTEGPSAGPAAFITTSEAVHGSRSLQVVQMPGNLNGTDFRVVKGFTVQSTGVLYARWYIKFDANWHWGTSDHKMVIFGNDSIAQPTQEVYCNTRAAFPGGTYDPDQARICIHNTILDNGNGAVWTDNRSNRFLVNDTWYRVEVRIQFGTHGSLQMRLDGVDCVFTQDGGAAADISDQNVGPNGFDFVKMDSTYNDGDSVVSPIDSYWDGFALGNNGWIGTNS